MQNNDAAPKRLVIVDDETDVRDRFSEALEGVGWIVATCSDGSTVNDTVKSFNPTVILLDLRMPKKDGRTVLKELRVSHPWIQIVILTGHGDEEDAINCLNNSAFRYLRKPATLEEIFSCCEEARLNVPPVLWSVNMWYKSIPDKSKVIYNTASGLVITAEQLMEEIRGQTPLGQEFIQRVQSLASELIVNRLK